MIIFKSIKWKNLLSTGNVYTEIDFQKSKSTLVNGENGAGKTTLLDALAFVLFGKAYRNINIPQLVNSINEKDLRVEIEFAVGPTEYKVIRGLSPKILEIHKDGDLIDQDSRSKDYQNLLETQILKMSYKSFCQVVILGSTNYIPFMSLTAADRRSVVEALLDINIFSIMNTILKGRMTLLREDMKNMDASLKLLKQKLESQTKFIDNLKNNSEQILDKYNTEVDDAVAICEELKNDMISINTLIKNLSGEIIDSVDVLKTKNKLESLHDQIAANIKTTEKSLAFYKINDTCPTCTQSISKDVKCEHIKEKGDKIEEFNDGLTQLQEKIDTVDARIVVIENLKIQILGAERDLAAKNSSFNSSLNYITKIQTNIQELKVDSQNIVKEQSILSDIQNEIGTHHDQRKTHLEDSFYYNVISNLIKDGGIKTKIINHYLPIMNKIINAYLNKMNFFVKFELDENFVETIKSRHRDIFTYDSFSEGEKRKIDLALLFAWRAIAQLKNSVSCNLLIFDEILDGSLDDVSTECFLDILKEINKKNTNVFVISHKSKDILQDKFDRHVTFVKKNNFSILV